MMGISSFDALCDLFAQDQDNAADNIALPTKHGRDGRRFRFLHNGTVKPWRASKGDHSYSRRDVDCEGRLERIQRELALRELRQKDVEGDFQISKAAKVSSTRRCGTQAPVRNTSSDVEDFGSVRVIKDRSGKIVAAFAGRDDHRPMKSRRSRDENRARVAPVETLEKVEKTGEEIIRDRRRRRKEAKLTRWLQPLPANHWGRRRFGEDNFTHDPITGRRYDELPASQKDAMIRQRLDDLQVRVDALPAYLQAEVMSGLTSMSWPFHRMTQIVRRLARAEAYHALRIPMDLIEAAQSVAQHTA